MHYIHSAKTRETETIESPFDIPAFDDTEYPDNEDSPQVRIDTADSFEGILSVRVIQWLVDSVKVLQGG